MTGAQETIIGPSSEIAARSYPGVARVHGVQRWLGPAFETVSDELAIEEPLQIRLAGEDVAVTMRTPGNDAELAVGFLFTEGIIRGKHDIESINRCVASDGSLDANTINVLPTDRRILDPAGWRRDFFAASGCGVCGKPSRDHLSKAPVLPPSSARVNLETLYGLPRKLQSHQQAFGQTGGAHAAALFDLEGNLTQVREDVGRHNAVDKIAGYALLNGLLPLERSLLVVSSRASFEIVQKSIAIGICILAVLSAPSTLAVSVSQDAGQTLVAFLREGRLNVYSVPQRIIPREGSNTS